MSASFTLYQQHLQRLMQLSEQVLAMTGLDGLLIYSGASPNYFLDDYAPPLKTNPHFSWWLPFLAGQADCWLLIKPGQKPRLAIYAADDFWHVNAALPQDFWCELWQIELHHQADKIAAALLPSNGQFALISPQPWDLPRVQFNPNAVLAAFHFARAEKTPWEQHCLRQANRIAARGHRYLQDNFTAGLSEFQLHLGYQQAVGQQEYSLPYNSIIAYNHHAAVLHYQYKDQQPPPRPLSLLADAGASYYSYAADITRTHVHPDSDFNQLVTALDQIQQQIVAAARPGVSFIDLHQQMHQQLWQLLQQVELVRKGEPDSTLKQQVSASFFPHGLGHLLGLQVHDIGGWQCDAQGRQTPAPAHHPYLRLTRPLAAGFVVTIEPGLYFIEPLLQALKQQPGGQWLNWALVEKWQPYGGIRIEDNILIGAGQNENFTRDSLALLTL